VGHPHIRLRSLTQASTSLVGFTTAASLLIPQGRQSSGNYLIYGMASQALFRSDAGSNRGLDPTFGFDWNPGDVSRENSQITAGVRFNAPFSGRAKDRIACGFVYSKISIPLATSEHCFGGPLLVQKKRSS
jgi:hypothetical protein